MSVESLAHTQNAFALSTHRTAHTLTTHTHTQLLACESTINTLRARESHVLHVVWWRCTNQPPASQPNDNPTTDLLIKSARRRTSTVGVVDDKRTRTVPHMCGIIYFVRVPPPPPLYSRCLCPYVCLFYAPGKPLGSSQELFIR